MKKTLQQIADEQGISRQAVWLKTPKGKDYQKTDKFKAYQKAYKRAYQRAYQKTDKYKAYLKVYRKIVKYKAYQRVYQKAYHKRTYIPVSKLRELGLIK